MRLIPDLSAFSLDKAADALAINEIKANRLRLLLRLAVAVRGGFTPADFIAALAETEAENGRDGHARVYKLIEVRMRSGEYAVHEALFDVTTSDDRCFLYAEDKVPDLSELLQMAYDTAHKKKLIVAVVRKPFVLPLYLFFMACGILVLGCTVMLPNFVTIMPVALWEFPTQVVYLVGQFLVKWWPLFLIAVGGLVGGTLWSLPRVHSEFRTRYLDRVFPWSLYKSLHSSSFILNIAAMFRAKVPILEAVKGYAAVSTPYASFYASRMRARLESEQTASDMRALDVGFIDRSTMDSMKLLNNKLPAAEVIQKIGDAEFDLLASEVEVTAKRSALIVTVLVATVLLFSLYGTLSVVPTFMEKMMAAARS